MYIRPLAWGGSAPTGARQMPTLVTSMLSSAQPVTGIFPASPVALLAGVSKLPNGTDGVTLVTFTWTCWGEPGIPAAVTVMAPLGPALAVTWKLPLPLPEDGNTVIFG